ncbi:MAG TPA: hypothetical protein VJS91_07580 [Nitrososphaeraceae archaeon]|nr:hypothetical protein [Nitrososphaeraceae archaeon]
MVEKKERKESNKELKNSSFPNVEKTEITKKISNGICLICGNVATKVLTYEANDSEVNETYCDSCFEKRKSKEHD